MGNLEKMANTLEKMAQELPQTGWVGLGRARLGLNQSLMAERPGPSLLGCALKEYAPSRQKERGGGIDFVRGEEVAEKEVSECAACSGDNPCP